MRRLHSQKRVIQFTEGLKEAWRAELIGLGRRAGCSLSTNGACQWSDVESSSSPNAHECCWASQRCLQRFKNFFFIAAKHYHMCKMMRETYESNSRQHEKIRIRQWRQAAEYENACAGRATTVHVSIVESRDGGNIELIIRRCLTLEVGTAEWTWPIPRSSYGPLQLQLSTQEVTVRSAVCAVHPR